jgi:ribosomal protein L14
MLARSPELRARLGDAAHATVREGFTAQASARAFADVLRDVVARAGRAAPRRAG